MKALLFLSVLLCSVRAFATDYYISSTGNDSRTPTEASNAATPWKTISKVNSFFPNLKPGDRILFKRGETFYGTLSITKSGTSAAPITIGAYGSGAKPILTGFITLTGWISKGSGVYESTNSSLGTAVNIITVNNNIVRKGRYPNYNAAEKGYLKYESVGTNSIVDKELTSAINWTGGELVLRTNHWVIDRVPITSHSGTTIYYGSGLTYTARTSNYGYFIQNHIKALDLFGEWMYTPSTKKVAMFSGSSAPSSNGVKASVLKEVVKIDRVSYITLDNLNITGANEYGIYIYGSSGSKILNCVIELSGKNGITANNTTSLVIENSSFLNSLNNAIDLPGSSHSTIVRNNTLKNTGIYAGMGPSGNHASIGIRITGDNGLVENNRVDSTGYIGIRFAGDNLNIRNNLVNYFCFVKDDGAGIYTAATSERVGRKISNNIVINGIGAKEGTSTTTSQMVSGIYLDANSSGVAINGNTIANCGKTGIYVRNCYKVSITNNTCYNNAAQHFLNYDDALQTKTNNIISKHNIFFSKTTSQPTASYNSKLTEMTSFGIIDSNYYVRPFDDNLTIAAVTGVHSTSAKVYKYTLEQWSAAHGHDKRSKKSPLKFPSTANPDDFIRFEYNASNSSKQVALNATYIDAKGKSYSGTISLAPYTSVVLMKSGSATPSADPVVTITSPTINQTFSAPATVRLTANTVVASGTSVSKVEFYRGATLITTEKIYPWDWTWTNVAAGSYSITAKVYTSDGKVATSTAVPISISSASSTPASQYVVITSPTASSSFNSPATVLLTATAAVPGEHIHKVDFYHGTKLLKTEYTAPYEFKWTNLQAGTYSVTAKALATDGIVRTSASVSFTVKSATAASVEPFDDFHSDSVVSSLKLYPNPAVNSLGIYFSRNYDNERVVLKITNTAGATVNTIIRQVFGRHATVDVSSLRPGVYTIVVMDKSSSISKAFIKQ